MKKLIIAVVLLLPGFLAAKKTQPDIVPVFNRMPLVQTHYAALPIGAIKPEGWLRGNMQTMLDGMTGHLDEIYGFVVGDDNAWLGGEGDAWERGPYWIDGALPMAYIMDDAALRAKVDRWVEAILKSQKPNGFFGPDTDRDYIPGMQRSPAADWWPRMVALKILQQYYMATGDRRVIDFMTEYFHYQAEMLPVAPLGKWTFWATERGGDNLLMVYWLYNITRDEKLLSLGEVLHSQTVDWKTRFTTGTHLLRQNTLHCVNLAHGFKEPVVYWQVSRDDNYLQAPKQALQKIRHTIGFPTGLWAGDEMTHFGEPTRGSELCTTVEMMYSLEEMYRITGDAEYADLLERIAFNALPTQISPDGDARQYYHQINQVEATRKVRNFSTMHEDTDVLFGQMTGYPCCTCNLHQGWPKFVQNLWYATSEGGVAAMIYAPCRLETSLCSGEKLIVEEKTCYPFEERVEFVFSFPEKKQMGAEFPFEFRVPKWSDGYTVKINGEQVLASQIRSDGTHVRINRRWNDSDRLTVEFKADVKVSYWYDNAAVIERGALIYALKMDEQWRKCPLEGDDKQYGEYYYEVVSDTPWNVALLAGDLRKESIGSAFRVSSTRCSDAPWSAVSAPIEIKVRARKIKDWALSRGSAAAINYRPQQTADELGEQLEITLIPFGCTRLRIAEFPVR